MYNALTRGIEAELLPALKRFNISFYAYNPLAGGILTGTLELLGLSKGLLRVMIISCRTNNSLVKGTHTDLVTLHKYWFLRTPGRYQESDLKTDQEDSTSVNKSSRFFGNSWAKAYQARFWKSCFFEANKIITAALETAYASGGEGSENVGDVPPTLAEASLRWLIHHSGLKAAHNDKVIIGISDLNNPNNPSNSLIFVTKVVSML